MKRLFYIAIFCVSLPGYGQDEGLRAYEQQLVRTTVLLEAIFQMGSEEAAEFIGVEQVMRLMPEDLELIGFGHVVSRLYLIQKTHATLHRLASQMPYDSTLSWQESVEAAYEEVLQSATHLQSLGVRDAAAFTSPNGVENDTFLLQSLGIDAVFDQLAMLDTDVDPQSKREFIQRYEATVEQFNARVSGWIRRMVREYSEVIAALRDAGISTYVTDPFEDQAIYEDEPHVLATYSWLTSAINIRQALNNYRVLAEIGGLTQKGIELYTVRRLADALKWRLAEYQDEVRYHSSPGISEHGNKLEADIHLLVFFLISAAVRNQVSLTVVLNHLQVGHLPEVQLLVINMFLDDLERRRPGDYELLRRQVQRDRSRLVQAQGAISHLGTGRASIDFLADKVVRESGARAEASRIFSQRYASVTVDLTVRDIMAMTGNEALAAARTSIMVAPMSTALRTQLKGITIVPAGL